jgi:hypothetical protein
MTPTEFTRLADLTRLKPAGREMARRVLVSGIRPSEVARQMDVADATVRDKVAVIAHAMRADRGAPADWVAVTVLVPPAAAREVLEIERRVRMAETRACNRPPAGGTPLPRPAKREFNTGEPWILAKPRQALNPWPSVAAEDN